MSAAPRIIEGTWEEVAKHATEFAGHRLKVIVLDETPNSETTPEEDEAWAAWLENWAYNRKPVGPWDDSRDAIYGDDL